MAVFFSSRIRQLSQSQSATGSPEKSRVVRLTPYSIRYLADMAIQWDHHVCRCTHFLTYRSHMSLYELQAADK
ncbi:hypothetical protein SLE2022_301220 [Rubroshorea leprosula]